MKYSQLEQLGKCEGYAFFRCFCNTLIGFWSAVPSFRSEWFWWDWQGAKYNDTVEFMQENYPPDFSYPDFAKQFTAEFYNATQWAQLFQEAGAKWVLTDSLYIAVYC